MIFAQNAPGETSWGSAYLINSVAEIKIRAERRLGEMLKKQNDDGMMNKGVQLAGKNNDGSYRRSHDATTEAIEWMTKTY